MQQREIMFAPFPNPRAHVATRSTVAFTKWLWAAAALVSVTSVHGMALARGGHGGGGHSGGHSGGHAGSHSGGGHSGGHFSGGHFAGGSIGGYHSGAGSGLVFHDNSGSPRSIGHISIGSASSGAGVSRPSPINGNFVRPWVGHDLRNRYPAGTRTFGHVSLGPRHIAVAEWGRGYWGWRGDGWLWIDSSWWASPVYPDWIWIGPEWVWDGNEWIQLPGYWVRANA
jgi:hypothetical protein